MRFGSFPMTSRFATYQERHSRSIRVGDAESARWLAAIDHSESPVCTV